MRLEKIGNFLQRSKIPIDIKGSKEYKRVTIRINHNGVSLRDIEIGKKIGTKKQFVLKAGQFILSKIDARYGAFGIAPNEVEGAIITGNFWAYDVDSRKVNIEWFNQFTNSRNFYEICERASSGITHRKYLDEDFFLNYEIPLPSPDEQLKQIEKIKKQKLSFGELTSELSYQSDLLTQLRQSFLREAMQGKLVKQNPKEGHAKDLLEKIKAEKAKSGRKEKELPPIKPKEIPFEIPENWVWCRLGEIALYSEAGKSFKADDVTATSNEWGVIKTSAITSGAFIEEENKRLPNQKQSLDKIRVQIGDILFCRASGSKGLAGKSCLVNLQPKARLTLSDKSIRYIFPEYVSKNYIQFYNSSIFAESYYGSLGTGKSTSMNNITRGQFNYLPVPLPPTSEQTRIVKKLEWIMQLCDDLQQSIQVSREKNDALLQQVLKEALIN